MWPSSRARFPMPDVGNEISWVYPIRGRSLISVIKFMGQLQAKVAQTTSHSRSCLRPSNMWFQLLFSLTGFIYLFIIPYKPSLLSLLLFLIHLPYSLHTHTHTHTTYINLCDHKAPLDYVSFRKAVENKVVPCS